MGTRPEQVGVDWVRTGGGVWAPTIRHHDGIFHVIVTVAMSPRGCVVFTATDPARPWSGGITIDGIGGFDRDLAWDEDGTAYLTFSGLYLDGGADGHKGIQHVRVDLAGRRSRSPEALWSSTGLKFPEAPHPLPPRRGLVPRHRRGGHRTRPRRQRGPGPSPEGPFTPHPANPVFSARSTDRPIQNTSHADLVEAPDGGTALVLLGVRRSGRPKPSRRSAGCSPRGRLIIAADLPVV